MLLFVCPNCEAFSVGDPKDYPKFLENHSEATCESFSYKTLSHYMNNFLRLFKYFDEVGNFSKDDLITLLIDTFSEERDRISAEIEKETNKNHSTDKE